MTINACLIPASPKASFKSSSTSLYRYPVAAFSPKISKEFDEFPARSLTASKIVTDSSSSPFTTSSRFMTMIVTARSRISMTVSRSNVTKSFCASFRSSTKKNRMTSDAAKPLKIPIASDITPLFRASVVAELIVDKKSAISFSRPLPNNTTSASKICFAKNLSIYSLFPNKKGTEASLCP